MLPEILSDPFGERSPTLARKPLLLLGGRFRFDSNSPELLRLVDSAYAGLPRHRLPTEAPELRVSLLLTSPPKARKSAGSHHTLDPEPPPLAMLHGAGFLGGAAVSSNVVVLSPRE